MAFFSAAPLFFAVIHIVNVSDISTEIYTDLDSPASLSVSAISFWILGHVGDLNALIGTTYTLNEAKDDYLPEIEDNEKAILKAYYFTHYYDRKVRSNLDAAAVNISLEVSSDGGTVKTINKNEISKTYLSALKEKRLELAELIKGYNNNQIGFKQHIPVVEG